MNPELQCPEMDVEMDETVWSFFGTTPEAVVQALKDQGYLDKAVRHFVAESGYVYERYAMKVMLDDAGNVRIVTKGIGNPIGEPINASQAGTA